MCRCGEPLQGVSHSAEWETALPTGTRVRNRYIIRHQLGQGGFGGTYLTTVAPHSDLYALAVTAVVLLTGKQPQELINPDTLDWVWSQQLSLIPQLRGILNRMLASRPSERFLWADEILQQLPPRSAELERPLENRSPVQEQALEINPQSSSVTDKH